MKRIAEFLRGVGGIGDDLIAEASEEELKGHTIRRRVSFRGVCGGIAACLVLAAAVFFLRVSFSSSKRLFTACSWQNTLTTFCPSIISSI